MSEAEAPERRAATSVSVEDVRALMGASTPHFALQLRNRIAKLIDGLPAGDPARVEGEREIRRLQTLGFDGETRGAGEAEAAPGAAVAGGRRRRRHFRTASLKKRGTVAGGVPRGGAIYAGISGATRATPSAGSGPPFLGDAVREDQQARALPSSTTA